MCQAPPAAVTSLADRDSPLCGCGRVAMTSAIDRSATAFRAIDASSTMDVIESTAPD